jgi:hypothetical protein
MQRPVQGGKMKGWVRDVCVRVWGGGGGGGRGGRGVWFVNMHVPDTRRGFSAVKMNGEF